MADMKDIENAIEHCKQVIENLPCGECKEQHKFLLSVLQEKLEREKGCEYCKNTEAEYQHTHNTKLIISTWGKIRTLITECNPCPPYTKCGMKNIPARSAFIINYCPECGRKLGESE